MNAEIEHASPYGKEVGEKVPGQKRKLGPAAMRAWLKHRTRHGEKPPSAEEVKEVVGPPPPHKEPGNPTAPAVERSTAPKGDRGTPSAPERPRLAPAGGFGDLVIGTGVVMAQAFYTLRFWRRVRSS